MPKLTSTIVDILCAFDTDTIVANKPKDKGNSKDQPFTIASELVFMTVKKGSAIYGNAGANLNVGLVVGDVLRWRETSLSNNFEESVMFYNFVKASDDSYTTARISLPPEMNDGTVTEVQPAPDKDGWKPAAVSMPYHYWQSTAKKAGVNAIIYHWQFLIAERIRGSKDFKVLGYFQWDPYITINEA